MTDFQPKNLNELESYLEKLALREGPVCFALFKSIQRIGHLSSPDVLEYVRIAQNKMADNTKLLREMAPPDIADRAIRSGIDDSHLNTVATVREQLNRPVQMTQSEARALWDQGDRRPSTIEAAFPDVGIPLAEGDDERTPPGDPLPIAGNPLSGAGDALERHVEIMRAYPKVETKPGPYGGIVVSPTTSEMTPAQQRAARARAARQANLAARRQ